MPSTNAVLIPTKNLVTAQTEQYRAPATGRGTIIDKFVIFNNGTNTVQVTVHLVSDAGASAEDIVIVRSLASSEVSLFPEIAGAFLAPNNFISTLASNTGATIRASGREIT